MKTIILLLSLNIFLFAVCTSSNTNPGYLYNKPDIHMPNTSTLSNVVAKLGEPAVSKMSFRKQLVYKYYYNMPNASVDTGLMIKGNYDDGCKDCGEIIVTFTWGKNDIFNDFVMTEIFQSDKPVHSAIIK